MDNPTFLSSLCHLSKNGGTCSDGVDNYTCRCTQGFTGRHCETGKRNVCIWSGPTVCVRVGRRGEGGWERKGDGVPLTSKNKTDVDIIFM